MPRQPARQARRPHEPSASGNSPQRTTPTARTLTDDVVMEASPLLQRDAATVPSLPTYAKTRDSGVEWLGDVPAHWEVRRLGQIGTFTKGRGGNKDDEAAVGVPCVRYGDLYTTHEYFIHRSRSAIPEHLASEYTPVRFGDVLFATSGETLDEIGKSAVNLMSSEARCGGDILVFRHKHPADARYMGYATGAWSATAQKARMGRGITVMHIYGDQLKRLAVTQPPLAEQAAIARFLDYVDRCTRRAVRQREKLIALLEEQQQVIVQQAITGQIDVQTCQPYPAYRDSEVQWLTKVPAHWPELALGTASKSIQTGPFGSQLHANEYIDDGVPVINPSHLSEGRIAPDHSIAVTERKAAELSRHRLAPGDIVMARRGEVGRSALVRSPEAGWICGTGSLRLRPRKTACSPDYLLLVLNSSGARDALEFASVGSTMSNLNAEIVSRLRICLPPLPEQIAIAEFCRKATDRHTASTDRTRRQIALLREFRTRLTADVVTGKLDVRGAAASLPEADPQAGDPA